MKSHITNRKLAGYIARSMGDRSLNRIAGHLAQCDRCRARHEKMLAAIAPRYHTLRASDAAKIRVMRSRDKLAEDKSAYTPGGIRSILALHPRAALAVSLTLAAVIVAAATLLFRPLAVKEQLYLAVARADKGITVNGHTAGEGTRVFGHSGINLPEKTMMRLEIGTGFSITLVGPADFSIDRLMSPVPSMPVTLECTLSQGILVSASDGSDKKVAYTYNTPGARIEPAGTEFLLQSAGSSTLVLMKTGNVIVKSIRTDERVMVSAGKRCVVSDKSEITQAAPEDLGIFGSMEQLRAGNFARRLLKPGKPGKETLQHMIPEERPGGHGSYRNTIRQEPEQEKPGGLNSAGEKAGHRDTTANPVKPDMGKGDQINKNKKLIREAQRTARQNRRTAR